MAGSVNKVTLLGNVGKDPEIKTMQSGDSIANLSIATSESWVDKNSGEKKERTEWHRIVCFNPGLTSVIERFVKKGSKVYVEGALQTRKWTDQQGIERYSTEIVLQKFNGTLVLCGDRGEGSSAPAQRSEPARQQAAQQQKGDLDDEIPF